MLIITKIIQSNFFYCNVATLIKEANLKDDILIVLSSWNWPKNNIMQKKIAKPFDLEKKNLLIIP